MLAASQAISFCVSFSCFPVDVSRPPLAQGSWHLKRVQGRMGEGLEGSGWVARRLPFSTLQSLHACSSASAGDAPSPPEACSAETTTRLEDKMLGEVSFHSPVLLKSVPRAGCPAWMSGTPGRPAESSLFKILFYGVIFCFIWLHQVSVATNRTLAACRADLPLRHPDSPAAARGSVGGSDRRIVISCLGIKGFPGGSAVKDRLQFRSRRRREFSP